MSDLEDFEGHVVTKAAVKITRAGDGLSEALTLRPEALRHGEEVWLVVRGEVTRISHDAIPKAEGFLQRVHTIQAREVALVPPDEVEALLDRERARVTRLREERAGVQRLLDDPLGIIDADVVEEGGEREG